MDAGREQRRIVLQPALGDALQPGLIRSRTLWLQIAIDAARAAGLISELGGGRSLERGGNVRVGAVRFGKTSENADHWTHGIKQSLSRIVRVGRLDQLVLYLEAHRVGPRRGGKSVTVAEVRLVANVRPYRGDELALIQRHRPALTSDIGAGESRNRDKGLGSVVAVGEIPSPVVLQLQLRAKGETLIGAEQRKGKCSAQMSTRHGAIDIDDCERERVVESACPNVGRCLDLATRATAARRQSELGLLDRFAGAFRYGERVCRSGIRIELCPGNRSRILGH